MEKLLEEVNGMRSYRPLWETMKEKQVSQYRLIKEGIDTKTIDGLKKGKNITLEKLEKLCNILECSPNDIVEFVSEEKEQNVLNTTIVEKVKK